MPERERYGDIAARVYTRVSASLLRARVCACTRVLRGIIAAWPCVGVREQKTLLRRVAAEGMEGVYYNTAFAGGGHRKALSGLKGQASDEFAMPRYRRIDGVGTEIRDIGGRCRDSGVEM